MILNAESRTYFVDKIGAKNPILSANALIAFFRKSILFNYRDAMIILPRNC